MVIVSNSIMMLIFGSNEQLLIIVIIYEFGISYNQTTNVNINIL